MESSLVAAPEISQILPAYMLKPRDMIFSRVNSALLGSKEYCSSSEICFQCLKDAF